VIDSARVAGVRQLGAMCATVVARAPVDAAARGLDTCGMSPSGNHPSNNRSDAGTAMNPHWMFNFRVDDIEAAVLAARASGGVVVDQLALPDGDRIAVCDDPQGAAFALRQPAP
jgi:hypothetical protein